MKINTITLKILLLILLVFLSVRIPVTAQSGNSRKVIVAAVGDIFLGWHLEKVYAELEKEGRVPFDFPFMKVRDELAGADVVVGNLEAPFTTRGEKMDKKFNFRVNPVYVKCLKSGGVSVVNLANNHIMDYGSAGLIDTMETLKKAGIKYSGAGKDVSESRRPAVVEVNGMKVAFLGFSNTLPLEMNSAKGKPGVSFGYPSRIRKDVMKAKRAVDFVVVSFHWGAEKSRRLKRYQKEYARLAVDSGADVVIGHHPHVLQGIETYRGKVIAYSLGNFVFGGNRTGEIRESMILFVSLSEEGIDYRIAPVDIAEVLFQPQIISGKEGEKLTGEIMGYSTVPMTPEEERKRGQVSTFNKKWQ